MKRVVTGLALALAVQAFADHPQTINKTGFVGVNKTQSAQSLGHSKLSFYGLLDGTTDVENIAPEGVTERYRGSNDQIVPGAILRRGMVEDYIALGAQVGFGIGLWHYFDLGVGIPIYYDKFKVKSTACPLVMDGDGKPIQTTDPETNETYLCQNNPINIPATDIGYIGNIKADLKIRLPLPDEQPVDIAVFAEGNFGTVNTEKDGLWIREPEFINKNAEDPGKQTAQAYGTRNTVVKAGGALTLDFDKIDALPVLIHGNGGYVYSTNKNYLSYPYASGALEIYFMDFLSLFAEYYMIFQLQEYADQVKLDVKDLTGAIVFHLPIGLDIHLGGSYSLGSTDLAKFTTVYSMENESRLLEYKTTVTPKYKVYGGITWSGFLLAQDRDGDGVTDKEDNCPDDFGHRLNQGCPLGNPDVDEDGVCDAWVSEKGFEAEFRDVCEGIDACPNEQGEGDDGCPLEDPDPDGDHVCDPWVAKKKLQKKFKDVCEGIDSCPAEKGTVGNKGCPEDNPDPDADGMCSPWVTDKNKLGDYANVCKGYDMCPGEAGPKANKGCPWDDPDSDGDGLCDEWVTQKKMGFYFEKAAEDVKIKNEWFIEKTCKGIDKCPTEFGPANNEGCPLGEPDTDKDGICDEWVTQKNMLDQYEGICSGIDKCPTEPGEAFAQGCPMDNPDIDGDSLCAPWVTEKKMQDQFKDVCHGIDKCASEAGPEWNKGCPAENPDSDADGMCDAWVGKQKMFDQFKDVCTGTDRCPDEPGPDWNKGCPAENPDGDGDGLCDAWVGKQKMFEQFKDVCKGTDRCPDEAGPEWNKGCPMDDDPDADKDGVCSEWVSTKKLLDQFKDVCTGLDRCPDVAGDDGHGCPKKAVEKLTGVTFKPGKATLESNAKNILKAVAKKLNEDDSYKELNIVIQGHTDNKGKDKTNQKLSEKRAQEVMKTLVKFGVKKSRVKAVGLGASCPVDDNSTEDGREMNRRIEMHFATPENDGTKCESEFVP